MSLASDFVMGYWRFDRHIQPEHLQHWAKDAAKDPRYGEFEVRPAKNEPDVCVLHFSYTLPGGKAIDLKKRSRVFLAKMAISLQRSFQFSVLGAEIAWGAHESICFGPPKSKSIARVNP